jgi:hypothetical protein
MCRESHCSKRPVPGTERCKYHLSIFEAVEDLEHSQAYVRKLYVKDPKPELWEQALRFFNLR